MCAMIRSDLNSSGLPAPLYATLSNDSLEPTPDYALYQDQANDLNVLSDRIDGLIKALKVTGCYDASLPALARLFTEGENTSLIPVSHGPPLPKERA